MLGWVPDMSNVTQSLVNASRLFFAASSKPPPALEAEDDTLPLAVARAIEAAYVVERPGESDRHPKVLIMVGTGTAWIDGQQDSVAELKKRFPQLSPTQAQVAERFLRDVLRHRRRNKKRKASFVNNW